MSKLIRKNSELCQKIARNLRKIIEESKEKLKPKLVILYGSIARGDWHKGSDIDLLVITELEHPNVAEATKALQTIVHGHPIEPHVYTIQEFDQLLTHGRMTALDALTEGIIIYAEKGYLKNVKEKLEQTMEKLKPEKTPPPPYPTPKARKQ
jgi:predicted nucleotidyltransferase